MIQVEGGQNKTDSPLRAMEHGILESELGEEKKKKEGDLHWDPFSETFRKITFPESSSYPVSSEMGGEDDSYVPLGP